MSLKDKAAIVGVGATPYYRRGQSLPQTPMELAGKAILLALDDAGLTVDDLDGFALYSRGFDPALFAQCSASPRCASPRCSPAAVAARPDRSGSRPPRSRAAWPRCACR